MPAIDRALVVCPLIICPANLRLERKIVWPCYFLPIYVHDCFGYHLTHLQHQGVKRSFPLRKNLVHPLHHPVCASKLLERLTWLFPQNCVSSHLWLLSFGFAFPWIIPEGSHSFNSTNFDITSHASHKSRKIYEENKSLLDQVNSFGMLTSRSLIIEGIK